MAGDAVNGLYKWISKLKKIQNFKKRNFVHVCVKITVIKHMICYISFRLLRKSLNLTDKELTKKRPAAPKGAQFAHLLSMRIVPDLEKKIGQF